MTTRKVILRGDHMQNGYLMDLAPKTMRLVIHEDGRLTDDGVECTYYCQQWGSDCPIITAGRGAVVVFAPDSGELERVGIMPTQR